MYEYDDEEYVSEYDEDAKAIMEITFRSEKAFINAMIREFEQLIVLLNDSVSDYDEMEEKIQEFKEALLYAAKHSTSQTAAWTTEDTIELILKIVQETLPSSIRGAKANVYPRSGRAKTSMSRFVKNPPKHTNSSVSFITGPMRTERLCFCLEYPVGFIDKKVGLPITRYGKSQNVGFYHQEPIRDAQFTWYYFEPDSDKYIIAKNCFVARNKLAMYLLLKAKIIVSGVPFDSLAYPPQYEYIMKSIFDKVSAFPDPIDVLTSSDEIEINKNGDTNYFRNMKKNTVDFDKGGLDFLDEIVWKFARMLDIDVLVFTHQSGSNKRLVAECLDVRPRSESLASIVTMEKTN